MKLSYKSAYVENMNDSDFDKLVLWIQLQKNAAYTQDVCRRLTLRLQNTDIKNGFIQK